MEVIFNSVDANIGVINEENAEGGINIPIEGLEWYEREILLDYRFTHCPFTYFSWTCQKGNANDLHWTFIHIKRCVCERCQLMDSNEECLCCQEIAPISEKILKFITKYDGFRGSCLNIDVWEISMSEFINRHRPLMT